MAQADIKAKDIFTHNAGLTYNVVAGATVIKAGEPVVRALGANTVTAALTASPAVGTHYLAGIAITNSTNTATTAGVIAVVPVDICKIYTIATSGTAYANQAAYDALVGRRVTLTLTGSTYTIATNAADGATGGLVLMPIDVARYPGKAAFRIRAAASDLA